MPAGALVPGGALAPRPQPAPPVNPLMPPTAPAAASPPATGTPPPYGAQLIDKTNETGFGNRFGRFAQPPVGMIIHHTGGGRTVEQVINTYKNRKLPAQFVIDRDGNIYQTLPDGAQGQQIQKGWGSVGEGKSNANTEGVEIIADNDNDVTPAQQQAAARLVMSRAQRWGYDPQNSVWGHGEVNPGHKEPTEGRTVVMGIRDGSLLRQIGVPESQIHQPPQIVEPTPETTQAYAPRTAQPAPSVPPPAVAPQHAAAMVQRPPPSEAAQNVSDPTVATPTGTQLSWVPPQYRQAVIDAANHEGIDPNLLAGVIQHESGFNQATRGRSGEIGLGQLMPDTARGLGVDPNDPNQNIQGAARYLHQQLVNPRSGGDVGRALQMYNGGPGTDFSNTAYPQQVFSDYQQASGSPYTGTGLPAGPPPPRFAPTPQGSGVGSGLPAAPSLTTPTPPSVAGDLSVSPDLQPFVTQPQGSAADALGTAPAAPPPYAAAPAGSGMASGLSSDPTLNIQRFADPAGYADYNPLYGSPLRVGGAPGTAVQQQQQQDTQPGGPASLPYPGTQGTPATAQGGAGGPGGASAGAASKPPGQMTAAQMFALGLSTGFRGVPVNYDPWASLQRFPQERGRPSSYLGGLTPVSDPRIPVPSVSYSPVSNPFFQTIGRAGGGGYGAEISAQSASYSPGG